MTCPECANLRSRRSQALLSYGKAVSALKATRYLGEDPIRHARQYAEMARTAVEEINLKFASHQQIHFATAYKAKPASRLH
jgi:hypothetical protein